MRDIRIAAAQFEHRDGDKVYNLGRIRALSRIAAAQGAEVVCFHECSITAYTYLQTLSRDELDALAEPVPDGPSVRELIEIARESGVVVMAGLIEREPDGRLYKSYAVVGPEGFLTKFHKLHPFISPHLIRIPEKGCTLWRFSRRLGRMRRMIPNFGSPTRARRRSS